MANDLPNKITIGPEASPIAVFENNAISRVGGVFSVDVVGDELAWDEISTVVRSGAPDPTPPVITGPALYLGPDMLLEGGENDGEEFVYVLAEDPNAVSNSDTPAAANLMALPGGTSVIWNHNNGARISRMYLINVSRVGKYLYRLQAASAIWLLDNDDHPGDVYSGSTFSVVLASIIGGKFTYSVGAECANQEVHGWLPYDTRRNNLHQLLFELGVAMLRDQTGNIRFDFLSQTSPTAVPAGRVVFGGSVEYNAPATAAEVTEHAFFVTPNDETVELFDNTSSGDAASNTKVIFDRAPVHDLQVTGTLTILASGVNYAIVSGVGTLSGKLYTHTTRIVREEASGTTGVEVVKRVENMTLISSLCSRNVAKRVLAYFSGARRVRASIRLDTERVGQNLSLLDPYNEPITAFLSSAEPNASTDLLAPCELIEGYTPTGQGNAVKDSVLLTGSGTWTATRGGSVTLVLVGPGDGGSGGQYSAAPITDVKTGYLSPGTPLTLKTNASAGSAGGAGGAGGSGGKILIVTFAVTAGQSFAYNLPAGGAGGNVGEPGGSGGASTFGSYSSASGEVYPAGYYDVLLGQTFGAPGTNGADGANGGDGGSPGKQGENGENSAAGYLGGIGAAPYQSSGLTEVEAGGGGGGAATNSMAGQDAQAIITIYNPVLNKESYFSIGGGGNAGDYGRDIPANAYGCGGNGGDGGSGAGGGGGITFEAGNNVPLSRTIELISSGGPSMPGGRGSAGGSGCARLYIGD